MSNSVASTSQGLRVADAATAPLSSSIEPRALRVLHVHAGNMYGGVETMLLTQARQRNLCPALESSFALCFDGRFSRELLAAGAHVHPLGEVKIRQLLTVRRARRKLRELLRRQSFDAVVTHSCWSQAIFGRVARAAALPLVFYQHGPSNGRHWLERLARRVVPDAALCNSMFTAATLSKLYTRLRAEIIYCPVAPPDVSSSEQDARAATRAEWQTPPRAAVIIQVSRMETLKGQLLHLEALGLLKDLPGWVCWQVGGAQRASELQYLEELKLATARLGIAERVRFLHERSDVARLLAAADIFCQPNIAPDSFGLAFIEALYARLPVVTMALGGACEIVDDSCGVLVPPGDANALAASLRSLIQDQTLRARLGEAGPARARQLCDPATQMKKFHAALEQTIQERATSTDG
jgi:glycosyltransferase involved in cell wall biosynthesis